MCGIVGVYAWTAGVRMDDGLLAAMRDEMSARGPDDAGLFSHHGRAARIGLGHRRLAIIDLSPRGRQPMSTPDERLTIVYNGEVFNHRELRTELERAGRKFVSDSDTEVVLHSIQAWGLAAALRKFRGMYAFALFDRVEESLTLVRDPLGVKPLYYRQGSGHVIFASEIKGILAHPQVERAIDSRALGYYLTFANSPAPHTLFRGISKLEPGCYLKFEASGAHRHVRFWSAASVQPRVHADERECVEELRSLLRQAVARRMVSDVPFGVFLSGGVDSSLNVALMAELMERPVETYSVGIAGDPSNEFEHARTVAGAFGTNHHEIQIGHDDFERFFDRMAYIQDEPLADPVCVPLYYLSKLARQTGTLVVQVGEGSDEIFAGYGMYHRFNTWHRLAYRPAAYLPGIARQLLSRVATHMGNAAVADAARRVADGDPLFLGNAIAFWDSEKRGLLKEPPSAEHYASRLICRLEASCDARDPLLRIIRTELQNRLPELLLMRVDKMSMANSIETRVPFLDEDVVEFALAVPSALKFKNGIAKYILKKAAEGLVPNEIIYRRKWGFCGSATSILTPALARYAEHVVLQSELIDELCHRPAVAELFERHAAQPRFNSFKIWNLMNLALWHRTWFGESRKAAAA